jgi:hypothetical protein
MTVSQAITPGPADPVIGGGPGPDTPDAVVRPSDAPRSVEEAMARRLAMTESDIRKIIFTKLRWSE